MIRIESKSIGSTSSTGPRSLSPSPLHFVKSREREAIHLCRFRVSSMDDCSAISNDTGPISLSPEVCSSVYATNLIKAYRNHLSSFLKEQETFDDNHGSRSVVTSMRYSNASLNLFGYYFGEVTLNAIPDGKGILCRHDGQLLEGIWLKGEFLGDVSLSASTIGLSRATSDTSTCSSLSASVVCKFNLPKKPVGKKSKKLQVPEHITILSPTRFGQEGDAKIWFC